MSKLFSQTFSLGIDFSQIFSSQSRHILDSGMSFTLFTGQINFASKSCHFHIRDISWICHHNPCSHSSCKFICHKQFNLFLNILHSIQNTLACEAFCQSLQFTCHEQTWLLQFTILWHLTSKSLQTSTYPKLTGTCQYKHLAPSIGQSSHIDYTLADLLMLCYLHTHHFTATHPNANSLIQTTPLDYIATSLLKSPDTFSILISHIANLSFNQATFPSKFTPRTSDTFQTSIPLKNFSNTLHITKTDSHSKTARNYWQSPFISFVLVRDRSRLEHKPDYRLGWSSEYVRKSMCACRSVSVACRPAEKRRRRSEIGSIHRSILVGHRRPNRS